MRKLLSLSAVAAALVFSLSFHSAVAEPAAGAKGSIKGKITGSDGKPAAGVPVRLMHAGARKSPADAGGDAAETPRGRKARAKGTARPARTAEAVAETTADAGGEFAFADVAAGQYVVVTRMKGVGAARERVTVGAEGPANVTLTLKAQDNGKPKPKRKAKKA